MEGDLEKDEGRGKKEEGRGKMLAQIQERSSTADEEAATAMTCLFHFWGPHILLLPAREGWTPWMVRAYCQQTTISG